MTFDTNEILNLLSGYSFERFCDKPIFYEQDAPNFARFLKHKKDFTNFKMFSGASKCVIIPADKDYVIKIPFTGGYYEADDCEGDIYEEFTEAEEDEGWNYCLVESSRYDITKALNVNQFFVPTIFIGYTNDKNKYPIYVQPKCDVYAYHSHETSIEEREKTLDLIDSRQGLPLDWLTLARLVYGENSLMKLLNFLEDYEWSDLRDENIGFIDGKPIIFDYSDFFG